MLLAEPKLGLVWVDLSQERLEEFYALEEDEDAQIRCSAYPLKAPLVSDTTSGAAMLSGAVMLIAVRAARGGAGGGMRNAAAAAAAACSCGGLWFRR